MKVQSPSKGKVFVGMSGGVDSSVSAALLKERGFDVTGVFIKVWQPDWMECSWREDRLDAMRVCARLGIPFLTLDLEREYKEEVVDYMVREYRAGKTPNPDVMCNAHVKFGGFFDWAMAQGADYVATGHYARVERITEGGRARHRLLAGRDAHKDQSYFLWTITEAKLAKTLFPVGDIEKPVVRRLAAKFGLPTAEKRDSQGLCFIGKVDVKEFLSHYIEPKRGDVLDERGEVVGDHDGAFFLTTGERRGFRIANSRPDAAPYYVVSRDVGANTVTVSHSRPAQSALGSRELRLARANWISGQPKAGKTYMARTRYRQPLSPCVVERDVARFGSAQEAASGQSIVFYDGDECVGGAIVADFIIRLGDL